ncbi:UDP-glycosyltransferase [Rhyzopertha dominica]|nr:UDP-glycosyltransferase [Rhyzopertha dominica]
MNVNVVLLVSMLLCLVDGSKILGIFPFAATSHYILGSTLMKALAEKGHDVTIITPYREKSPPKNYKEVFLSGMVEYMEETIKQNMFDHANSNPFLGIFFMNFMSTEFVNLTLSHPEVQTLLNDPSQKFDLILLEQFLDEPLMAFAHHYKAPLVLLSTFGSSPWTNGKVGNPAPASYIPHMMMPFHPPMTFWQRLRNGIFRVYEELNFRLLYYPRMNKILKEFFPNAPPIEELEKNTSLILLNSHVSTNQPVPHVPNMIEIGGFHVKPPKKLPKDLEKFMNEAEAGVIYFSMGSNLKSKDMPIEKREAILKALSKLKEKVLWKFEDDSLPAQPANVKVEKWLPQQDVLAHPNIKAFITHGGLLSTIETIYHGVPIIGIPIFADQMMNMAKSAASGYAIQLNYQDLTEESLTSALDEILNNPKYRENAQVRSAVMKDQIVSPLDSAIYWVEYAIRHNGAPHFRSAALDLAWYQYHMLDVIAFVSAVVFIGTYISWRILKMFLRKRCCQQKAKKVKKN